MMGGVNSSMIYLIYYKNFCKCYNVPPSTTIKKEDKKIRREKTLGSCSYSILEVSWHRAREVTPSASYLFRALPLSHGCVHGNKPHFYITQIIPIWNHHAFYMQNPQMHHSEYIAFQ
jgi:hypothetical protein